jgi:hypothetical protein
MCDTQPMLRSVFFADLSGQPGRAHKTHAGMLSLPVYVTYEIPPW